MHRLAYALIVIVFGATSLIASANAPHKIFYLAPDNPQFRKQLADFEAKLRAKPLPPISVEFVPFRQFTHTRSLDELAAEIAPLAARKPLAIVTPNFDIAKAAIHRNIPVQMVVSGIADPVGHGVVVSLNDQAADVTGHTRFVSGIDEKRLSLLKEVNPKVKRVGLLLDKFIQEQRMVRHNGAFLYQFEGIEVVPFVVDSSAEAVTAIRQSKTQKIDAWYIRHMIPNYNDADAQKMIDAVNEERLPSIYDTMRFVRLGGLMAYQAVLNEPDEVWARNIQLLVAGVPARNVPFESPRHFYTVVNTATAARQNITLPATLMRRVDLAFPCKTKAPLDCMLATPKLYERTRTSGGNVRHPAGRARPTPPQWVGSEFRRAIILSALK